MIRPDTYTTDIVHPTRDQARIMRLHRQLARQRREEQAFLNRWDKALAVCRTPVQECLVNEQYQEEQADRYRARQWQHPPATNY